MLPYRPPLLSDIKTPHKLAAQKRKRTGRSTRKWLIAGEGTTGRSARASAFTSWKVTLFISPAEMQAKLLTLYGSPESLIADELCILPTAHMVIRHFSTDVPEPRRRRTHQHRIRISTRPSPCSHSHATPPMKPSRSRYHVHYQAKLQFCATGLADSCCSTSANLISTSYQAVITTVALFDKTSGCSLVQAALMLRSSCLPLRPMPGSQAR